MPPRARSGQTKELSPIGDRANFGFTTDGETVIYLYAHWGGEGMLKNLANALDRVKNAHRLDDPAYATRIAISEIIGENWGGDLGFGITINSLCDNEHKVPVVNWSWGVVTLYRDPFDHASDVFTMSISAFINKYA